MGLTLHIIQGAPLTVSLPREYFGIDRSQSSGGREGGLLLSDNREYNMWFRGKVLLHLPTSAKSLAFSWIFTSYFLREAIFCALKWYTGPAKSWRRLFMPTCERVHSSLPTFISITPFAILIFEPQPFHTDFGQWEGSVPGRVADRPYRYTPSATPFRKDLQL